MKYQSVIWDIDGTLLNTEEGLVSSYLYTIDRLKLPPKRITEIKTFIGPVPQKVFEKNFKLDHLKAQQAADMFRDHYKKYDLLKAHQYDAIIDVLSKLHSIGMGQAVATNKRQDYALEICQHFGIDKYCSPIFGPDNISTKSKADLITECLRNLGTQKAVMIGDTEGDKTAAKEANIDFIGVNYGFGFHNVPGYANKPSDLLKILEVE